MNSLEVNHVICESARGKKFSELRCGSEYIVNYIGICCGVGNRVTGKSNGGIKEITI